MVPDVSFDAVDSAVTDASEEADGQPDAAEADADTQVDAVALPDGDASPDGDADAGPDADIAADVGSELPDAGVDTLVDADSDSGSDVDAIDVADAPGPEVGSDVAPDADAVDDADGDAGPPPPGPFDDLESLSGAALEAALLERIEDHTPLLYGGDGTAREFMYSVLDVVDGRLECIYTGRTVAAENPNALPIGTDDTIPPIDNTPETDCRWPDGSPVPGGCSFNTEHSWPQANGADIEPMKSDIHHLFATFGDANAYRSNYNFGDTTCTDFSCTWSEGGSELGTAVDGYTAFEVRPKYRGNIARAQFYFAVRYQMDIPPDVEVDLRGWHAEDPPDAAEIARNEAIFAVQGNRNPFVSRPDFVALIDDF